MDSRALSELPHGPGPRELRKRRTRRALLDAALTLMEDAAFASLSLRQVTKQAGVVPTAFYRHFDDMDALGEALVDEAIGTLRRMIRSARADDPGYTEVITRSAQVLVRHVHEHREHFRFIARERSSGVAAVRLAIREQLRLFVSELAEDLQAFPVLTYWGTEDRQLLAEIIVNHMVITAEALMESPPGDEPAQLAALHRAEKQLRMIVIGLRGWNCAAD